MVPCWNACGPASMHVTLLDTTSPLARLACCIGSDAGGCRSCSKPGAVHWRCAYHVCASSADRLMSIHTGKPSARCAIGRWWKAQGRPRGLYSWAQCGGVLLVRLVERSVRLYRGWAICRGWQGGVSACWAPPLQHKASLAARLPVVLRCAVTCPAIHDESDAYCALEAAQHLRCPKHLELHRQLATSSECAKYLMLYSLDLQRAPLPAAALTSEQL